MSKQLVQTVYIPDKDRVHISEFDVITHPAYRLQGQKGIFFTVEEYNAKMKEVIEETLTKASEFAELEYECGNKTKKNCLAIFCRNCNEQISRDSILNTFEQSYKKFKI